MLAYEKHEQITQEQEITRTKRKFEWKFENGYFYEIDSEIFIISIMMNALWLIQINYAALPCFELIRLFKNDEFVSNLQLNSSDAIIGKNNHKQH